jgi:hypothetical protein
VVVVVVVVVSSLFARVERRGVSLGHLFFCSVW